mgnify:CR=1 FL=1
MQTTFNTGIAAKPVSLAFGQWFSTLFSAKAAVTTTDNSRVDNIRALQRMARDLEVSQPNLAAELRNFATRS